MLSYRQTGKEVFMEGKKVIRPSLMNWAGSIILAILLALFGIILLISKSPGGFICIILGGIFYLNAILGRASSAYSYDAYMVESKRGIISRKTSRVDLKDIKNIQFNQRIFDRIFGLGTLGFASAGTAGIEVVFAGISKAEEVKKEIEGLMSSSKEGTTGKIKCPQCAELIQAEAKVCRFCGHKFS